MQLLTRPTDEEVAALRVAAWMHRVRHLETLVAACAVFHAGIAVTLALAPADQLFTPGTRPALDLAGRYWWAAAFLLAATLIGMLVNPARHRLRPAAWILAFAIGGCWLTSLLLATWDGRGSAIAAWVWAFLYTGMAAVAVLHSLDRR